MTRNELIKEIERQRNLLIAVSTGGPLIDTVNDEYRKRRAVISQELKNFSIEDPNPYTDLWRWYGYWSSKLPTYASRRAYIAELYDNLIEKLSETRGPAQVFESPTGWDRVDRGVGKARRILQAASEEEDYQAVGLLCREILISLGQVVFDPTKHASADGVEPSKTDAKRCMESFIVHELKGKGNEACRAFVKNAVNVAVGLQHNRTATFKEAALCLEATNAVVNVCAVIAGQRESERETERNVVDDVPF